MKYLQYQPRISGPHPSLAEIDWLKANPDEAPGPPLPWASVADYWQMELDVQGGGRFFVLAAYPDEQGRVPKWAVVELWHGKLVFEAGELDHYTAFAAFASSTRRRLRPRRRDLGGHAARFVRSDPQARNEALAGGQGERLQGGRLQCRDRAKRLVPPRPLFVRPLAGERAALRKHDGPGLRARRGARKINCAGLPSWRQRRRERRGGGVMSEETTTNVMLPRDGALLMIAKGFRVFPLKPDSKEPFEFRDCTRDYWPLAGGVWRATGDPEQVDKWLAIDPHINFGVIADERCIVDVDVKKDKAAAIEEAKALLVPAPDTLIIRTWSGGWHYYYSCSPPVGQRKPSPSIDIRSGVGYVVCPGSWVGGRYYEIVRDAPVAPLPDHVRDKLAAVPPPREENAASTVFGEIDAPDQIAHCTLILKDEPGEEKGNRSNRAYFLACVLRDYALSADTIALLMWDYWNLRNAPSFEYAELQEIAQNAWKYARGPAGTLTPQATFGDIIADGVDCAAPRRPLLCVGAPLESAEVLVKANFTKNGRRTLHRANGDFMRWRGTHYDTLTKEEAAKEVWSFLGGADRLNADEERVPFNPTTNKVNDVVNALGSLTLLDSALRLPCGSPRRKSAHRPRRRYPAPTACCTSPRAG